MRAFDSCFDKVASMIKISDRAHHFDKKSFMMIFQLDLVFSYAFMAFFII